MKSQAYFSLHGNGSILVRCIIGNRNLRLSLPVCQPLVLHISDNGVRCLYLTPVFHFLQQLYRLPLLHFPQDRTLNSAPLANLGILHNLHGLLFTPLCIHLQMPVIKGIGVISILLHIVSCQVQNIPPHLTYDIFNRVSTVLIGICLLAEQCFCRIICCRIKQFLFIYIRIKTFIQILMHCVQVKIYCPILQHRFFG